jgi:hypothetical protein
MRSNKTNSISIQGFAPPGIDHGPYGTTKIMEILPEVGPWRGKHFNARSEWASTVLSPLAIACGRLFGRALGLIVKRPMKRQSKPDTNAHHIEKLNLGQVHVHGGRNPPIAQAFWRANARFALKAKWIQY